MKLLSVFLYSLAISTTTGHRALQPRQNSASSTGVLSTTSPTGTATNTPSQTSSESITKSDESGTPSAAASSSASSQVSSTIDKSSASGTTSGLPVTATNGANDTTRGDPIPLPLQPKITPAIGFAGAVLMVTGLAYTLVGIKNQWLYSFFGVAYLVSLATTVLIIYCMNPPVSDGVQGAFLVAVIFAGSLAGGVALIFRDLADGVGCLLGGFCLSMWFLCLKAGGLIPSILGKSIFIGCMSVAVFSLAISSKTRNYALIGSIPFSGATVTILGIDCFSRAGLKEFWIYIWNINDNEFPLNTNTYPMTRGIKVEVAGIILLFLLGLATQLKLAKMVRQRREQKDAHRSQQEKDLEREEAAVGQRVEQNIQSERVKWENVYGGGKSQTTISGAASVDTLGKSLGSVREKRVSGMSSVELSEMSPTRDMYGSKQPRTTVTVASAEDTTDEIQRVGSNGNRLSTTHRVPSTSSRHNMRLSAGSPPEFQPTGSSRNSLVPPAPEVVPLPFKIPGIEIDGPRSNQGSLSAIEDSYMNSRRLSSKRGSGASYQRRSIGNVPEATVSEEDLIDDYENDKDSSLAATFDELDEDDMSLSAITVPRSPMDADFSQVSPRLSHRASFDPVSPVDVPLDLGAETGSTDVRPNRTSLSPGEHGSGRLAAVSAVSNKAKVSGDTTAKPGETGVFNESGPRNAESSPTEGQHQDIKGKRQSATTDSQTPTIGNLAEHLPENVSKVVLQYRTNEWAKHLSLAETPEQDGLADPPSPGVKVDTSFETEFSKERTPLSPVVDPDTFLAPVRPMSKRSSTTPSVQDRPRTASAMQSVQPLQASPIMTRRESARTSSGSTGQQTPPMSSLSRNSSAVKLQPAPISTNSRNSLNAMLDQPLVESPVESPVDQRRVGKMKKIGSDMPQKDTLLTQRDSQLRSKPRSKGFAQSSPNMALGQGEFEELPNSHRKPQLKSGARANSRRDSRPPITTFDSHQPMRESSGVSREKREDLLNGWRESLRQERKPQALVAQAPIGEEARRARMINEKRQREFMNEQEKLAKATRDSNLDHMMRNGNMIDVHKQALRNMQAGAKI